MRKFKAENWILLFGFIALGAFIGLPRADAAAILTLSDGSHSLSVTDGGAGDFNPTPGVVTYIGALPGSIWVLNVTTGLTMPFIGDPSFPKMDLNSVNVSSRFGSGTLQIDFAQDSFTGAVPGFVLDIGGVTNGSITYSAFYNDTLIGSIGPYKSGAFSESMNFVLPTSGDYALRQHIEITHDAGWSIPHTSFNASLSPVPEPGTILLLGSGLAGLAAWGRKKILR